MKNIILISSLLASSFTAISQDKSTTQQQGTTTYAIKKHTLSAGGGVMTDVSNIYKVTGVIGQIDAGHNATNSPYVFTGGFLHGATPGNLGDPIFKNGFE
jgi:hypothetical protein